MKITIMTLLFSTVSILAIINTVGRLKKDSIGVRSSVIWLFMWSGIAIFSLFPSLLDWAVSFAQMENRLFFILVLAVFILFGILFNLSYRLDKIERNIGKIVQKISILEYRMEKESDER